MARVDTPAFFLVELLTIIATKASDVGFESRVDRSIPHFGSTISGKIIARCSLVQGDAVFQGQITFDFLDIGGRHSRSIAIDNDFCDASAASGGEPGYGTYVVLICICKKCTRVTAWKILHLTVRPNRHIGLAPFTRDDVWHPILPIAGSEDVRNPITKGGIIVG